MKIAPRKPLPKPGVIKDKNAPKKINKKPYVRPGGVVVDDGNVPIKKRKVVKMIHRPKP